MILYGLSNSRHILHRPVSRSQSIDEVEKPLNQFQTLGENTISELVGAAELDAWRSSYQHIDLFIVLHADLSDVTLRLDSLILRIGQLTSGRCIEGKPGSESCLSEALCEATRSTIHIHQGEISHEEAQCKSSDKGVLMDSFFLDTCIQI